MDGVFYPPVTPSTYVTPLLANENFEFVSALTIFPYSDASAFLSNPRYFLQIVKIDNQEIFRNRYVVYNDGTLSGENIGFLSNLKSGIYEVYYEWGQVAPYDEMVSKATYIFSVVENKLPLKSWTVTDVITRTLDLAEPIRKEEMPRFRLNTEQAEQFDKILAPEFSFTKETLRETLQEVGHFIHGEPRLTPKNEYKIIKVEHFDRGTAYLGSSQPDHYNTQGHYIVYIAGRQYSLDLYSEADGPIDEYYLEILGMPNFTGDLEVYDEDNYEKGKYYYEVSYDMYASQEQSGIYTIPYIRKNVQHVVDSCLTWVDSNAENLVNQLDKYSGVIVEPYEDGAKTMRTENMYVRIEEGNMIIPTQYPIYTVDKLEYLYVDDKNELQRVDITAWLFEKSIYDTQLSSYQAQFPFSKVYGIYYSQGKKNIGGLTFKVSESTDTATAYGNYSIVNIIRQATGNDKLTIGKNDYPKMSFRVTYTPFYNARVGQTKSYFKDSMYPAALIYNQQANVIESRYYGENLKGAVARLGNVEKSFTYLLYNIKHIPKAGQMFDKDYYISAVAVSLMPTCIICTIGLSKDFNRISAYIGINSEKRYSEISQTQAVERNTLYREYIVIGEQETPDNDCLIGRHMLEMIADTFTQIGEQIGEQTREYKPLTNVCAWGTSYKGNDVPAENIAINLPVISSAFGNAISFSWQYADNYSAGATSHYEKNDNVSGYFQNDASYTDYYGRLYYYNFDLQPRSTAVTAGNLTDIGLDLPQGTKPTESSGYVSTIGKTPYIMRKDNREALQVNFQIDFVTNLENIIIGSALASYCPAVRGSDTQLAARLYVFDTGLNKFTDHVEAYENVDLSTMPSAEVAVEVHDGYFTVSADAFPKTETGKENGKSWAIITQQYKKDPEQVEDEFGEVSEQQEIMGGDLLIGQNIDVTAGQAFTPSYFTAKREIFDKTVWKDKR